MKIIALYARTIKPSNETLVRELIGKLVADPNIELWLSKVLYKDFPNTGKLYTQALELPSKTSLMLSLGGDGTLLDTVPYLRGRDIAVMGVNMGHLGFLTSFAKEDLQAVIDYINKDKFLLDKRRLLELNIEQNKENPILEPYALNDIVINKSENRSLLAVDVLVNGKFLNTYVGDGLIIASPTGSTAYSLSCGGPILSPRSNNLLITPIASHSMTVRPLVLPGNVLIELQVKEDINFKICLDSQIYQLQGPQKIRIKMSEEYISLLESTQLSFFEKIRNKLMWGAHAGSQS